MLTAGSRLERLYALRDRIAFEIEVAEHKARLRQPAPPPKPVEVRRWARANGYTIGDRGRVPQALIEAYVAAKGGGQG